MLHRLIAGGLLAAMLLLAACGQPQTVIRTLDDAAKARIGVMTGSTGEAIVIERYPAAEVKSFDDIMDSVTALHASQLDAVVTGFPAALQVAKKNPGITLLDEPLAYEDTAIAVRKGNDALLARLNDIIATLKQDGTLEDMHSRWFKQDLTPYLEPELVLPTAGEPLRIGVSATREPFSFVDQDGRVTGHDGELARVIGVHLGRPVEFFNMKFMALIPALESGKVDLIITGMTATEERRKSVDFTVPYYANAQVMLVKAAPQDESPAAVAADQPKASRLAALERGRIAVLPGSAGDLAARRHFPSANFQTFTVAADAALAVRTGKADAFVYDKSVLVNLQARNPGLEILAEPVAKLEIAPAISRDNPELAAAISRIINDLAVSGELAGLRHKWIATTNDRPLLVEPVQQSKTEGVLKVGTSADIEPFSFVADGRFTGLDIELAHIIAARLGKSVEIVNMSFEGLIPALQSGKIDVALSNFNVTEERKTQVLFATAYVENDIAALVATSAASAGRESSEKGMELHGKHVGVVMGSAHEAYATAHYSMATVHQYKTPADVALAVRTGKVDVALFDAEPLRELLRQDDSLEVVGEPLFSLDVAAGFNKDNTELKQRFDAFLVEIRGNGVYDDMVARWMQQGDTGIPHLPDPATGDPLVVGVSDIGLPFAAVQQNALVGFDIELVKRFAASLGKGVRLDSMEFGSLVAAVASGKADMIIASIYVTEDRQRQISFSAPYFRMDTLLFARKGELAPLPEAPAVAEPDSDAPGFLGAVIEGFHSNIIQENRYLLLWSGLKTTVTIAVFATLFGTLLGSGVCYLRMSSRALLRVPAQVFISVLRGTPVLVVLMLIFYVVFASVDISPVVVAIIAFGLNFAAYAGEIFRSGIQGVDRGQMEAGIAMGFSRFRTFLYIVLPQTIQRILPVYKGEFISLVKMTSIVGYIAVQDLTKASDIIRSRTFDAFFPLVMVAILYFVISWVLIQLLEYLERLTDPKQRRNRRAKA
ncbi:MAG: ABC transporter substrate-binding protein/permease [Porticoccaceae bacterium]|nr:ABC transporter substrate-binding protein/permease [Porticoccaceae bacterium]